jgi:class 3 adenylate cyclase
VAQENDAERAVRAALAIQRSLAELNRKNASSNKPSLAARIAIDLGPVVVDATARYSARRQTSQRVLRDCPDTLGRITKFSKHEPN